MTSYPFIIGLSGKMGSGKDYIAKEVIGDYLRICGIQYLHLAFSDALKVHLLATIDDVEVTFESLYIKKTAKTRKLLQNVATQWRQTDDKIWIKHLEAWLKVYRMRGVQVVLISDVRFPIEIDFIKKRGGIIFRIISPKRTIKKMEEESGGDENEYEKIRMHMSEIILDNMGLTAFDGILYNDEMKTADILAYVVPYIKGILDMGKKIKTA
jgi:hypothetical protein